MNNSIKTIISTLLLSQATFAAQCGSHTSEDQCEEDGNDCTWESNTCMSPADIKVLAGDELAKLSDEEKLTLKESKTS